MLKQKLKRRRKMIQNRRNLKTELLLYPCPVTLVTSRYEKIDNVCTVSWSGIVCSHPEFISISLKENRYSFDLIKQSGVFGVNMATRELLKAADYCGTYSGREVDKFSECSLTKFQADIIDVPLLLESPVNIECIVHDIIDLGGHKMFIGRVVNKLIDSSIPIDQIHNRLSPVAYFRPNYYGLEENSLGFYGMTAKE